MQPRTLDEFAGQRHLLGDGRLLRRAIEADRLSSLILYGPPGCGKTALAYLVARLTRGKFRALNAVTAGVADIREVVAEVERTGTKTILFVDEIHRFNKVQQDALLPEVEEGKIILIGASTENPFFALVPALSSRSLICRFNPLSRDELRTVALAAVNDSERGLGKLKVNLLPEALEHLLSGCEGDARRLLNALETGVVTTPPSEDGSIVFDLAVAEESVQTKALVYGDDEHYDVISAFIKSIRGSDPDAAVYWMARMIEAGEDPLFIARRIVISASEDIGNADPHALPVAVAAMQALERLGMPEGRIPLAQAVTYLASAPKSNAAYNAINAALSDVKEKPVLSVPPHLRDAHYKGADRLGHGKGYQYPHDYPGHFVEQAYLPEKRRYYEPSDQGAEAAIRDRLKRLKGDVEG
ncbi:MAG: replication-associated recombination protein A [Nitrospirota bacterium]|nr:replication-associated recombination protein A [Nitrospirota bacterium]